MTSVEVDHSGREPYGKMTSKEDNSNGTANIGDNMDVLLFENLSSFYSHSQIYYNDFLLSVPHY